MQFGPSGGDSGVRSLPCGGRDMKLGIMQPYFFPYLGYFDLIRSVDRWVVFDTAQYIRHGWVNRNRVLHPSSGWQYVLVPLAAHARETPIREIRVHPEGRWKDRIVAQLAHYKKRAPHFRQVIDLVRSCLAPGESLLSRINVTALARVCEYLGIPFRPEVFSEMGVTLGPVTGPGDWALRISLALGAFEYINPSGGRELFDPAAFAGAGIRLTIREFAPPEYPCRGYRFEPGLSIIDAMMWLSPDEIRVLLDARPAGGVLAGVVTSPR